MRKDHRHDPHHHTCEDHTCESHTCEGRVWADSVWEGRRHHHRPGQGGDGHRGPHRRARGGRAHARLARDGARHLHAIDAGTVPTDAERARAHELWARLDELGEDLVAASMLSGWWCDDDPGHGPATRRR